MAIRQLTVNTLSNLRGGFRLALLLPVTRQHFVFSQTQLLTVLFVGFSLDIAGDWFQATPPREINYYGISYLLSVYFVNLFTLYIVSMIHQKTQLFYQMVIMQYASYPLVFALGMFLTGPVTSIDDLTTSTIIFILLLSWVLIILYKIIRLLSDCRWWLALISLTSYLAINLCAIIYLPEQPLWYGNVGLADDAHLQAVNTENTYYRQTPLLQDALHFVAKGNPEKEELYFLGFAPDATRDVFLKESQVVQRLMDEKFGTRERSLLLASNLTTYHDQPLANGHNLHAALTDFGHKMDDDDILMLFLTSHGSKTYQLAVNFAYMRFNDLPAAKLATMLDNSGIKWRIIIVSACYSGGFIDQLKNPQTLIITAAARDKQSSGCSSSSEATWFTDAYFKQALVNTTSFTEAFDRAKPLIRKREQKAGVEYSDPQLYIGDEMQTKLSSAQFTR